MRMFKRLIFITILLNYFLLCELKVASQSLIVRDLHFPLDIPLAISGNFGELRSNTFHAGIDFKTSAMVGLNVYAVDDGYISRIKVDLNGFGRALYINHPNGTTSVYGHLEMFRDDIDRFCKKEQYKLKQFGIDLALKPNDILIKKGDIIAFAGNRGGSSGPHMHFEVRDTRTQQSLNVFKITNIAIPDTVPPIIEKIWFYPIRETSKINGSSSALNFNVASSKGKFCLDQNVPVTATGEIGIGLQLYDLSNNSLNKIGIYSIKMFVNDTLVFEQVLDKLSFDEMRYVNSLIDYEHYIKNGVRVNRLFVQPNNQLNNYRNLKNRGVIRFVDSSVKTIRIRVTDDFSNQNECTLNIKGSGADLHNTIQSKFRKGGLLMHYKEENSFTSGNLVKLYIPKDALYDDLLFEYSKSPQLAGYFSAVHHIHNPYTPLHRTSSLALKTVGLPSYLVNKALLVSTDQSGKVIWNGGEYKDGFVTANIRSFGNYMVAVDTVCPQVQPLFTNIVDGDFTDWSAMAFSIKDNLSGINSYRGTIDGQWALFEYDPKQDLLYYKFDPDRMSIGQIHKLELVVYDGKDNRTVYRTEFYK